MAARVIDVLEAYLKSFHSAAAAPLKCITEEQADEIFNRLSTIDKLHFRLRQKVQGLRQERKRKVESLLKRTPNVGIIAANLRRIYGPGKAASKTASQAASSLRDAHFMVVWRWIRTIPIRDWDNGGMSADMPSLVMARMVETEEAFVLSLRADIKTYGELRECDIMKKMAEGELSKSKGYLDFYNTILQFRGQQKSSISNLLNIGGQQSPQSSSLPDDTTVQDRTSKRRRLEFAQNTYDTPRGEDIRHGSGGDTGTYREEDTEYSSREDRFAMEAYASSQQGQTHGLLDDEEREIELVYTNAPVGNISLLGEPIASNVEDSPQRNSEKAISAKYTNCISVLVPKDVTKDLSLVILISRELGLKLIRFLDLQKENTPKLRPKPSDRRQLQNTLTEIVH